MQTQTDLRAVFAAGLWRNNAALVQLLGLCPLLAVTTSVVNGLALGLATAAVLTAGSAVVASLRTALLPIARVPLYVLITAALVTCVDLVSNALLDGLHQRLGIFIPLIVANSAVLAHAGNVASRRGPIAATLVGFSTGLGFLGVLVTLGALRELLGHGTLLADLPLLVGGRAEAWHLALPVDGMQVAVLPPGAFFGMALLLALKNLLRKQDASRPRAGSPMERPQ
ncbi:MAG TPA: electron transport complex subunit RsxE [Gammaproteobacteria bacterium]|nr:electron transport complex subunit RsxE [Gammaproteobacteria bacterium]